MVTAISSLPWLAPADFRAWSGISCTCSGRCTSTATNPTDASAIVPSWPSATSGRATDVGFRVGRFGRLEWEKGGEGYYVQFLPPHLLVILGLNLLGEALRDVLDPKLLWRP